MQELPSVSEDKLHIMIPVIIVMLLRHYQKIYPNQFPKLKVKLFYAIRAVLMIAVAFMLPLISNAQEKNLSYSIKRNGSKIGNMQVKEIRNGKAVNLKLQSDVKTSFIFTFSAKAIEEARYDSGILVFSSVYQRLNGTEKINKQIRYLNDSYVINNGGREEHLYNLKIYYNLVCIYYQEPVIASRIFSDKHQKFLNIQKLGDHHYRIEFPDGGANEYWFENGICEKIEIDQGFYSAVMELNK
jgi:hypothetical protein